MIERLHGTLRTARHGTGIGRDRVDAALDPVIPRLRELARKRGVSVIDPLDTLCDGDGCAGRTEAGAPMYLDDNHLTASYVRGSATYVDRTLRF
jgi:hypothetical protein